MKIWASEINELKILYESIKGQFPALDKELKHLIKTKDANVIMLYSRRCMEVIINDLCEKELNRQRKTEPLQGIIDKLNKEEKVPSHIITSMHSLNSLATYGAHPKDFDPEQVKPVLNNLTTIIKWYTKYKVSPSVKKTDLEEEKIPYGVPYEEIKKENERKTLSTASIFSQKSGRRLLMLISLFIFVVGAFAIFKIIESSIQTRNGNRLAKTIAVLPFRYLSKDTTQFFFCDGFMEELLNDLQKVKSFTVRSRTSSNQYRDPMKSSSVIGHELNANYLIEGSVEIEGDSIKIWVQLIKAKADKHVWSNEYIRETKQIFSLQSEIAKKIALELKTILTPEEIKNIDKNPTTNPTAYTKYLSGNFLYNDAEYFVTMGKKYNDSSSFENAIKAYTKAIEYDTAFALAYAKRAISRSWGYHTKRILDKSNIKKCKEDIDKALKINPDLTEAQIASGFYYYYCKKDYYKAIEHFQKAADQEPGNCEPVFYMASVYRRLGNWEKSQHLLANVLNNNFYNALILTNIGSSYQYLRNYDSALIYHEKAIEMMPGWSAPYNNKIETYLLKNGTTKEARIVLDTAIQKTGRSFMGMRIDLDIYDSKFQEALQHLQECQPSDFGNRGRMFLYYAQINNSLNNFKLAHMYYDSALVFFKNKLVEDPENIGIISLAGITCAGLNNRTIAIEYGKRAVKLADNDVLEIADRTKDLAQIYVMLKEYDNALREIEYLLKNNTCFSVKFMQLDPVWKPLIETPEFQKVIASSAAR